MADVEALYKSYGVLADAGDEAGQHAAEFEAIIAGTKGGTSSKRLAADFIGKFFTLFPGMADRAIEAQLDLCEDEDAQVRQAAIKALPLLCRDGVDNSQLGDVLAQLLQSESALETKIVRNALIALLKKDTRSGLAGLFYQVVSAEVLGKERAVAFLGSVVVDLAPELIHPHPEIEAYVLTEAKTALTHVLGAQFSSIMQLLRKLKTASSPAGVQQLAESLTEVGGFGGESLQGDQLLRALVCSFEASFLCKRGASPKVFIEFLVNTVMPNLGDLPEDAQLLAAKALASLAHPLGMKPEELLALCEPTLESLMTLLPEAPQPSESDDAPAIPAINYRVTECLLYAFHQLAKKSPEFLHSDDAAATRLRLLKVRLQFLGMCCQPALKDLKTSTDTTAPVTIKAVQNISVIIKTFLKVPPVYQTSIVLSFAKPAAAAPAAAVGALVTSPKAEAAPAQKRPSAVTSEMPKRSMTGKEMRQQYTSGRAQQPQQARSSSTRGTGGQWRGRGQGRGTYRGRGSSNSDWKGPNFS